MRATSNIRILLEEVLDKLHRLELAEVQQNSSNPTAEELALDEQHKEYRRRLNEYLQDLNGGRTT